MKKLPAGAGLCYCVIAFRALLKSKMVQFTNRTSMSLDK